MQDGDVRSRQVGFPWLLNKALNWGQEACIWGLYKPDFVEVGHVQSGHVGFPLLPKKNCNFTNSDKKFGSSDIHVVCGLAQPSYFMWHFGGTRGMKNGDI